MYSSSLKPELDEYTGTQDAEVDVLANINACSRDAEYLADLGVNTISTLYLDWSRSHDLCFSAFATRNIYIIALLESGSTSINGSNPIWNVTIYDIYKTAIDEVSQHNNTLALYAGYENVLSSDNDTYAFATVKAAIRDTKEYIRSKSYRNIPVGYAAEQPYGKDSDIEMIDYLTCGPPEQAVDFLGESFLSL